MKIVILKKNFKDGLSAVQAGISESNDLPVLKHVLIKTANSKVRLTATNLEIAVSCDITGKIVEEGGVAVPFATLYSICGATESERLELETENNNLLVTTDNYEAKIQGLPESDYPVIPKLENKETYIEFDPIILKNSFSQVATAAQMSEIRPEISGLLLDYQLTLLKLAATDSFRLSEKTIYENQIKTNLKSSSKVIIPLKTVHEIGRVFGDEAPIYIHIDPNQILIKNNTTEIISRVIDGTYPDYDQIIPKTMATELTLEKDHLTQAIKLVSSFSGKINDVHLRLHPDKKVLEVYSHNQYLGENNYLVPVKIKGENFKEVAFNWKYLLDGAKTINSGQLIFGLNGDSKPAILRSPSDASYFYIVMPIKV